MKLIKWTVIVVLASALLLSVTSVFVKRLPFEKMPGFKEHKPLVVLSGSMEPALKVGSVVVVREVEPADVRRGDIITFETPKKPGMNVGGAQTLTTHRVTKVMKDRRVLSFETKGDANKTPDNWVVPGSAVVGRAGPSVPYVGYVMSFSRTSRGFLIMVVLPALLIIAIEIRNILKYLTEGRIVEKRSS